MKKTFFIFLLLSLVPCVLASEGEAPVDDMEVEGDAPTRDAAAPEGTDEDFAYTIRSGETAAINTTTDAPRAMETGFEEDEEEEAGDPGEGAREEAVDTAPSASESSAALPSLALHIPAPPHALVSPELIKQAKELDKKKKKKKKKCAPAQKKCAS